MLSACRWSWGRQFECRGALGDASDRLRGVRIPAAATSSPIEGKDTHAVLAAGIAVDGRLTALLRVSRPISADGGFSDAEEELLRRLTHAAGAAMAAVKQLAATRAEVAERARELAVVSAVSQEITATLWPRRHARGDRPDRGGRYVSPALRMPTMCGCWSAAPSMISRLQRSTDTDCASSCGSTLTTTQRPSALSSTTNTRDIPPPPSSRSMVYACPSVR